MSMMAIGSAQFVNVHISIARVKVFTALLGPPRVCLLSVYNKLHGIVGDPWLTKVINDHAKATRMMNDHSHLDLAIGGRDFCS